MAIGRQPGKLNDPDLRDRLYELLEHEHLPHAAGSRFAQLVVLVVALDVMAVVLASVPDYDAEFGTMFTVVKVGTLIVFALE
jgi:voltage-gated potassium channel